MTSRVIGVLSIIANQGLDRKYTFKSKHKNVDFFMQGCEHNSWNVNQQDKQKCIPR